MFGYSRLEHDEAVRLCALDLLARGHEVRARVEGWFDAPDYINGYRPDIVARMGSQFIIIEVKKGEVDWPKISAFEDFVTNNHAFQMKVLTPADVLASSGNSGCDAAQ